MKRYNTYLKIKNNGKNAESELLDFFNDNENDEQLKSILIIDLDHIDSRAVAHDYIYIESVEHLNDNYYSLSYNLEYYIHSGCRDMDVNDEHHTAVNFLVHDNYIEFDMVDQHKDTFEEF